MENLINKIHNCDCLKLINLIPDKIIDLAIIHPPYNMQKAYWDTFKNHSDFLKFTFNWIDHLIPKIKDTGSLYIFNTPFNSAYIMQYLIKKELFFQNWITWNKKDGLGFAVKKYCSKQETILFFSKTKKYTFNYNEIRVPYESENRSKCGVIKNGKRWFPNKNGKLCSDVWHITSERHKNKINGKTQKNEHITIKPLELVERIIKASSNENDLVLDCFSGSGTTAIASKKLNRNFICSEADYEVWNRSVEKINNFEK